jgi:hypothetical protein
MPDHLFLIGGACVVASIVLLGLAQLFFTRLDQRIPERL